jgi:hypothetical protein
MIETARFVAGAFCGNWIVHVYAPARKKARIGLTP